MVRLQMQQMSNVYDLASKLDMGSDDWHSREFSYLKRIANSGSSCEVCRRYGHGYSH